MKTTRAFPLMILCTAVFCATLQAQEPATEKKETQVFGQKIVYWESGTGAPVILLHGMGADKAAWRRTISVLTPRYHVYVPDQLGFGESDKPLIAYRVGTYVDFLQGFMKQLGIGKASLVGNSMGGWVAALFAAEHPDAVDRLVLVDAAGYFLETNPPSRESISYLNPSTLPAVRLLLSRIFSNQVFVNDDTVRALFTQRLKAGDGYTVDRLLDSVVRGEDYLNGRTAGIKTPTLVLWGRDDALVPLAAGEALAASLPNAKKIVFDRCGHVPQLECAAPFSEALTNFLGAPPPLPQP